MKDRTICFFTPSYRGDFDRFVLQRKTYQYFGIDIPHIVVVPPEDESLFQSITFNENLRIVTSEKILPENLESRRLGFKRKKIFGSWRKKNVEPLSGWMIQQYLKLSAYTVTDADCIVCLDSDVFFCSKAEKADFISPDGKISFLQAHDLDCEQAKWQIDALHFFHLPLLGHSLVRYVDAPLPFSNEVLRSLSQNVEQRCNRKAPHWLDVLARAKIRSEYSLYGVYATCLYEEDILEPSSALFRSMLAQQNLSAEELEMHILEAIQKPDIKFCVVQSNLRHEGIHITEIVARCIERSGEALPLGL